MRRRFFDANAYSDATLRVVIYDNSAADGAHINIDDVRVASSVPQSESAMVFGFADSHAHPMSHLGFGERVIWGNADTPQTDCPGNEHSADGSRLATKGAGWTQPAITRMRSGGISTSTASPGSAASHEDPSALMSAELTSIE